MFRLGRGSHSLSQRLLSRGCFRVLNSASMSQFLWIAVGVLLLYFALRVVQMKRASLPFLIAYPLFVAVFFGGSVGVFVGMSWLSASFGLAKEASLLAVFGVTAVGVVLLWFVARRLIR